MEDKGMEKKGEVRVFLDGLYLRIIDDLITAGYGTNRSEVVRKMVHDWVMANIGGFHGLMQYSKKEK
jgi:metal-responsive CopG/Arc/MetJ family transcriptional regulator